MNRQSALVGVGVLAVAVVGWFGFQWLTHGRYEITTDNAYVRADISLISAKADAFVQSIEVADNAKVAAGDVLVRLDPRDTEARLAMAAARLSEAQANLAKARAEAASKAAAVRSAEAQIALQGNRITEARAASQAAVATSAVAKAERGRFETLASRGFVAPSRLETADATEKASAATVAQAQAQIAAQSAEVAVLAAARDRGLAEASAAAAAVTSAEAAVKAAEAALRSAENDRGYATVTAPVAGLIANRTAQIGQLVRPGTHLMAIVPLREVYVVANFKETQIETLRPGQKVALKVDSFPDLKVTGRIESVAPASGSQFSLLPTDTATGNFTKITQRVPVRIAVDAAWRNRELLRPGLSVVAVVDTRLPAPEPAVPDPARVAAAR